MTEQRIWLKGQNKLFKDLLPKEKEDFWNDIDKKAKHIAEEITLAMREANKDGILLSQVSNNDGMAIFKLPPKPHKFYKKEKLDAIKEPEIRKVLDECLEDSKQSEPTVKLRVY